MDAENEVPRHGVIPSDIAKGAVLAGISVVGGIVVQSLLDPDAQAWGAFEVLGFIGAIIFLGIPAGRSLREWLAQNSDPNR